MIVITGSTRGIGFNLAASFLELGQRVVVNGRRQKSVSAAVKKLLERYSEENVFGYPADVTAFSHVQDLWKEAKEHYGEIDIWGNNAGLGNPQAKFWELPEKRIRDVVDTNLKGLMYGCQVALSRMMEQGYGELYNMEGLGSDGRYVDGLVLYGSTKRGVNYLTGGLVDEVEGTPVIVGSLSPGMVITEMITGPYEGRPEEWEKAKRIFNILADRADTVCPWLAKKVLKNGKNGARIRWLTRWKVIRRFLAAPFVKRDLFTGKDVPE